MCVHARGCMRGCMPVCMFVSPYGVKTENKLQMIDTNMKLLWKYKLSVENGLTFLKLLTNISKWPGYQWSS